MNKISQYFSTLEITRGLTIAVLSSAFIYLNHFHFSSLFLNTLFGLFSLYLLLKSNAKVWFLSGAFVGLFWFWWIARSLIYYEILWAAPIEILIIMLSYGSVFGGFAWISIKVSLFFPAYHSLLNYIFKAIALMALSYVHPFSFDWFKPELMFVESYFGIEKWQFALILLSLILTLWKKQYLYLLMMLFAYNTTPKTNFSKPDDLALISTYTPVKEKWDQTLHQAQFDAILDMIDNAITQKKTLIVLPESVFPIFLNRSEALLEALQKRAKDISIVVGALYWDGYTPRNSTYIFTDNNTTIANKVLLVPFGEKNPLPDFLSDWVNKVFYDGSVDYKASTTVTDYIIDKVTYRNAICFEATSEKLYEGMPQHMIVLSNNAWFVPSIEPTLQKLLLQYYSQKYGTTIYHSINMSQSYIIKNGLVF